MPMKSRSAEHLKAAPTSRYYREMQKLVGAIVLALATTLLLPPSAMAAQVTTNLLIDLNAENPDSYPGSGTVWKDLAGGNDTATLTNGPVYDTATGGGFTNDGVNDYINIANRAALQPTLSNCFTAMTWAKIIAVGGGIMGKMSTATGNDGYALELLGSNALRLRMVAATSGQYDSAANVYSLNTWTLFTAVICFKGQLVRPSYVYVNSTLVTTVNDGNSSIGDQTSPIQIANGFQNGNYFGKIKVGAFALYDRALTAQEISDSYSYYLNYSYVPDSSSIKLSSSGSASKGLLYTITATVGAAGKVRFYNAGKRIPSCINVATGSTAPYSATCSFKPHFSGSLMISATFTPTNTSLGVGTDILQLTSARRATKR